MNHWQARRSAASMGTMRHPRSRSALADDANIFFLPMRTASTVARGSRFSKKSHPNRSFTPEALERDTDGRAVGFLSIMRDCNRRYPSARTRERAVYSNRGDDRPCDDRRSRQVSCRGHGWLRVQAAGPRGALPRRRILDGAIAITHTVSEPDARAGRAACVSGAHVALQRPPRSTQLTGFSRAITVFVRLVLGSRLAS